MIVIDHTNQIWRAGYKRINGAETYSKDLVKWQIPNWERVLGPNDVVSTCPRLDVIRLSGTYDTVIQYLHSFPFVNSVSRVRQMRRSVNCRRMIFISAYSAYVDRLRQKGFEAHFIPMSINVPHVQQFNQSENTLDRALLWFGNTRGKRKMFAEVQKVCKGFGFRLDVWANGKFNGVPISQEEGWARASKYKYGAAVGRCALELYALGVKVIIVGNRVGGIVKTSEDIGVQTVSNFNGRNGTFSRFVHICLKDIDESISVEPFDITQMNHAEVLCQ